jgi:hypothetical protein
MKKYFFFLSIITTLVFTACERNYDLSGITSLKDKPVVEGYIENGLPPYVFITKTFSLFGSVDATNVEKIYLHNANVTVSGSDGKVINLVEYPIKFGNNTIYIYTVAGLDFTGDTNYIQIPFQGLGKVGIKPNFDISAVGKLNTTYKLLINLPAANNVEAMELTAETKILNTSSFDSMWVIRRNPVPSDSFARLYIKRTDDASTKDFYRYFTQKNNELFLPGYNSTFNDEFTNGQTYDFPVSPGFNKNDTSRESFKNFGYYKFGDSVRLKLSVIDNDVFDFWQTADDAYSNIGNPFASPSNVKSNIKGGGLGLWSGYASIYYPDLSKKPFVVKF